MRFLLLSDIHDNLLAVEKMRSQEPNTFDAVVVAGDIGSRSTQQIFDVLNTFGCPVLYVYGNWDHELSYEARLGDRCHHLHLAPFHSGPLTFVGFSGCTAGWRQNPEAQRLYRQVDDANQEIIRVVNEAQNEDEKAKSTISDEYTASVKALTETSKRPPSQQKLKVLDNERNRKLAALAKRVDKVRDTDAYKAYMAQRSLVWNEALARNRKALVEILISLNIPRERLIVVTHDRLVKTQIDFAGVPVFLFGHRHGFTDTMFLGTRYINVSALDMRQLLRPKVFARGDHWGQFRNLNVGNYAVLEWDQSTGFRVNCVKLAVEIEWQDDWELETFMHMPSAPFLS